MNKSLRKFLPLIILFIILSILIAVFDVKLAALGFNSLTLFGGNIFLFLLSVLSFVFLQKGISAASPQAFVRYFYISFISKFFLVAIAALLYGRLVSHINRASIIACMALYIVYTFIEMSILLKAGKK
ncbi:MAG: hypothetical protein KF746_13925 [Chitinophagaceae bacterium]|nr:hypothetical protein [Chitinophagaceae bacterium]